MDVVGPDRIGVRLYPTFEEHIKYFGVSDTNPKELYENAICGLNAFPLAYLLLTEPRAGGLSSHPKNDTAFFAPLSSALFRRIYNGTLIAAGGFTPCTAKCAIEDGHYDLVAFGRWFLANPDLPERIKSGSPLNVYDREKFYSSGSLGYTDYPNMSGTMGITSKYSLMKQEDLGPSLKNGK